jgi:peroxiredoxin
VTGDKLNKMSISQGSNRRSTALITLAAGLIFILGALLLPSLMKAQEVAINSVAPLLPPTITKSAAPKLALTDLQGNPVSVNDYLGKVVLINNWATWCPPCKIEMPELEAYYKVHVSDGFVVIAIESGEAPAEVKTFVYEQGLTFPVWLDPHGLSVDAFQNWNLPSSYVIDRSGMVRLSWTGGVNQATLEKYVTPLLEENK